MGKDFWKALLIRTGKTWCQTFVGTIGGTATLLSDVNWGVVLSASTLSAIICFFWNLGIGLPEVELAESAYMDKEEPLDSWEDNNDYEVFDYGDEIGIPSEVEDGEE